MTKTNPGIAPACERGTFPAPKEVDNQSFRPVFSLRDGGRPPPQQKPAVDWGIGTYILYGLGAYALGFLTTLRWAGV